MAHKRLGDFYLAFALGGIGRVEFALGAVAQQAYLGALETLPHLGAGIRTDGRFDSVLVRGPQLDGRQSGRFESPDDRLQVHILEEVVRHAAELELALRVRRLRRCRDARQNAASQGRRSGNETPSIHG
jgi:hypothetical protein